MRFAICNETFLAWPLRQACDFARACGYTGLEIAPFTLAASAYDLSPTQRADVRKQVTAAGLEVVGLHWLLAKTEGYYLTSPDGAVRRRTAEYLCELARLCGDLGGHILVLGSPQQRNLLPGVSHAAGLAYAADLLRAVVPTLAERNVTLALEPLGPQEGNFLRTAETGAQLCRLVGAPQVQLHLDVKAMSSETRSIPEIIRTHAGRLAHFHANDPNRRGPGMGEVDFAPIFQALEEIKYRGWVSVEVFDYAPGPERLARDSIAYMQRVLGALAP